MHCSFWFSVCGVARVCVLCACLFLFVVVCVCCSCSGIFVLCTVSASRVVLYVHSCFRAIGISNLLLSIMIRLCVYMYVDVSCLLGGARFSAGMVCIIVYVVILNLFCRVILCGCALYAYD